MGQAKQFTQTRFSLPNDGWILKDFVSMNWTQTVNEPYFTQVSIGTQYAPSRFIKVEDVRYYGAFKAVAIFNMARIERTVRVRHQHSETLKYLTRQPFDVRMFNESRFTTVNRDTGWVMQTVTVPAAGGADAVPADRLIICPLKSVITQPPSITDVPLKPYLGKELFDLSRKYGVAFLWMELYHQRLLMQSSNSRYAFDILDRNGLPVQSASDDGITMTISVP